MNSSCVPNPAVVIPIYKSNLNIFEEISLRRALALLGHHPVFFLVPRSKQQSIQETLQNVYPNGLCIQWHIVDDHHMASHHCYNQLMLDYGFYHYYASFTHLLICQLDAYVFEDRLLEWCREAYDYVGGPLYPPNALYGPEGLLCVGVGGFSLRRVHTFLKLLQENPIVFKRRDLFELINCFNIRAKAMFLARYIRCRLLNRCRLRAECNHLSQWLGINEDVVYAKFLPRYKKEFRLPSPGVAAAFCIDKHVEAELFGLSECLPFAAHAWWSTVDNLVAWRRFIPELSSFNIQH